MQTPLQAAAQLAYEIGDLVEDMESAEKEAAENGGLVTRQVSLDLIKRAQAFVKTGG